MDCFSVRHAWLLECVFVGVVEFFVSLVNVDECGHVFVFVLWLYVLGV